MKLAFIIQAHQINNPLLYNIEKINNDKNSFAIINFDAKFINTDIQKLLNTKKTRTLKQCIEVNWGAISQFKATVLLLKEACKEDFDYVSFISGEDVIVGPIQNFRNYLEKNKGKEFFGIQANFDRKKSLARINCRLPSFLAKKNLPLHKKIYKKTIYFLHNNFGFFKEKNDSLFKEIHKGSNWFTITKDAAIDIINFVDSVPLFYEKFSFTYCADEILTPSILMSTEAKKRKTNIKDDNASSLRYVDWKSGPEYPKILHLHDLNSVKKTDLYFVRKISSLISMNTLKEYFD